MAKSKLLAALAAEKGTDFKKIKEKRNAKQNRKERRKAVQKPQLHGGAKVVEEADSEDEDEDEWEEEDDEGDSDGSAPELFDMEAEESDEDEDEDEEMDQGAMLGGIDESDSESEVEMEEKITRPAKPSAAPSKTPASKKKSAAAADEDDDEDEEDEEEEDDVAWSDLESLADSDKEDMIRHQRETINNKRALLASLNRIRLPTSSSVPFSSHQSLTAATEKSTEEAVPDPQDDLARELHFYAQSLDSAKRARDLLRKEGVPFSRPVDYFAEMVKDDGHMEKIKAKLVEEASAKKASAEARKQRDLKKFGKQVQVAKLQERQKQKKDTLEKIKTLKRKRQESSTDLPSREADLFDVSVDTELKSHTNREGKPSSRGSSRGGRGGRDGGPNPKRQKKDAKFGFGGKKKHSKSNDADSAGDISGFRGSVNGNMRGGRAGRGRGGFGGAGRGGRGGGKSGGKPRLGKARRQAGRN